MIDTHTDNNKKGILFAIYPIFYAFQYVGIRNFIMVGWVVGIHVKA